MSVVEASAILNSGLIAGIVVDPRKDQVRVGIAVCGFQHSDGGTVVEGLDLNAKMDGLAVAVAQSIEAA